MATNSWDDIRFYRRLSAALAGSRESGDALLEGYLAAELRSGAQWSSLPPRDRFLAGFYDFCDATLPDRLEVSEALPLQAALLRLPLEWRSLLVLTDCLACPTEEAATALGLKVREATNILPHIRSIFNHMLPAAVVVEDNYLIAEDLRVRLNGVGVKVCGLAATSREARSLISRYDPSVLFLDVQLADGDSGTTLAERTAASGRSREIVFVTAYPLDVYASGRPVISKPVNQIALENVVRLTCSGFTAAKAEEQIN